MADIKLLERLCSANGISGDEEEVRKIILSEIQQYADNIDVDSMGNIIVFKKGKERAKTKLLILAHMDEVGFIVNYINDEGFLKFLPVGGIDPGVICGKSVVVGENKIPGVIGAKPIHMLKQEEKGKVVPLNELYIDIGAKDKCDALKYVNLGDSVSFESLFKVNKDIIMSKAIDDRVGCLVLIEMIKSDLPYDMYFTFAVQEEVGLRGSKVAAYKVEPESSIVIEATTACDTPLMSEDKQVCNINEGAVISFMDKSTIYDKQYFKLALEIASSLKEKIQVKKAVAGGNDAGAIHVSRSGVRTIAVSLPCRYLHSPVSMISKNDLESTKKIVNELAKQISGGLI